MKSKYHHRTQPSHIMLYRVHLHICGNRPRSFSVIGTHIICRYRSNYHIAACSQAHVSINVSLLSRTIFQHHQCMAFTFHNPYVILELVPSIVIFWYKNYSSKATLPLGWNHAKKIIRSSSQSGWPLRNIHISNDNRSLTFYADIFFPLSLPRLLPTWLYIRVTLRVS